MYDIAVIGGGPAGSSAAITAARAGLTVLLLEAGKYPRQKVCGEFVSPESLELLSSLLGQYGSIIDKAPRLDRSRLFLDQQIIQLPVKPTGASITRFELDAALWNSASLTPGVHAHLQLPIQEITGSSPFMIRAADEEFTARAVILACGRWPRLERFRPTIPPGARWIGLKAHFEEPNTEFSTDLYFFENGYCGVQPIVDGRVNACAMVRSDIASSLEEVFLQNEALRTRSQRWKKVFPTVSTSPLMLREPTPVLHDLVLAGDSAGFIDPFAGDGIALALHTGSMAANCVVSFVRGECSYRDALRRYASAYRRQILPVFRSAARLRFGLKLPHTIRCQLAKLLHIPIVARAVVHSTRGRIAS